MIPFNGFSREPLELADAEVAAARRVIDSHWYVLGPEVAAFEQEWAAACGAPDSVGVANGLDAIEICLRSLGIGPGDEVITTPMTAFATILGIMRAGATPVLADTDEATALLSPDSVRRCVTSRTRAVLLVHLYGQMRQMTVWNELCSELGLLLIEDCAQAHLACSPEGPAGLVGAASAWSFYPTKNLGAVGDAGAVVSHDAAVIEKSRLLRNYGQSTRYEHVEIGLNSRLDELQAAILRVRLTRLAEFTERRREIADKYRQGITNSLIGLLAQPEIPEAHVHHLFVITSPHRDALATHLKDSGVETLIHYPIPAHEQPALVGARIDPNGLPNAERHARTCLSLPCHPGLTDAEIAEVIAAVNSFEAP
jgi:dTDP-4-amino-4,6-dideoxygalactose transaminase